MTWESQDDPPTITTTLTHVFELAQEVDESPLAEGVCDAGVERHGWVFRRQDRHPLLLWKKKRLIRHKTNAGKEGEKLV